MTNGDKPYYSDKVYVIDGRDRHRYILKNEETNKRIEKRYAIHQLLKVNKVIKGGTSQNIEKKDNSK